MATEAGEEEKLPDQPAQDFEPIQPPRTHARAGRTSPPRPQHQSPKRKAFTRGAVAPLPCRLAPGEGRGRFGGGEEGGHGPGVAQDLCRDALTVFALAGRAAHLGSF